MHVMRSKTVSLIIEVRYSQRYYEDKQIVNLDFLGKRSSMPPLGLLTIAGMFPKDYNLRVVDMNIECLTDAHLEWADVTFL